MKAAFFRFFQGKAKKRTALCVGLFALVMLIIGASLAYFTSRDTATNQLEAAALEIQLLEPEWQNGGIYDAQNSEPGMTIAKDPYVYNKSETSVYLRMQVMVTDEDDKDITNTARGRAILAAIYLEDETTPFLTVEYDEGTDTTTITSGNLSFYYYDGWFYYIEDSTTADIVLKALEASAKTPELFSYVKIPVLKTEYDGIFASVFHINVEAQAIPVNSVETTSLAGVAQAFADAYDTE